MFQYTGNGVALALFGFEIRWYAVLIVTGMILAVYLSGREAKRRGLDPELIYDLSFWVLPAAIIGARIWYVIFEWQQYQGDILKIINIRGGGLAIQGGVMAAALAGYFFCRRRKVSMAKLADIIFPYVALAQSIGRWGNFTNNEAFGGPTDLPWALIIEGQKVHPTFLYESLGDFAIFLFLIWFTRKKLRVNGQVTALYLILYGVLRFFVEGLRTDSLYWGPIRVAQLLAILGAIAGIVALIVFRKKKSDDYILGENEK